MPLFALPILFLLLLLSVVLLLFKRWKQASALTMVVLMLNWYWQVCPLHFISEEEPASNTFRVVTYNIYPQVDLSQYDIWQHQMLNEIKNLHPDILCLQEFKNPALEWLESELCKFYSYTEEIKGERKTIKWHLYSRYPMSDNSIYKPTEKPDTTSIPSEYDKILHNLFIRQRYFSSTIHLSDRDSVTVFSCHLQSNGYSSFCRSMKGNESLYKGFVRCRDAIKYAKQIRQWEAKNLRHVLDSIGNKRPVIVAGDFNDFNKSVIQCTIQGKKLHDAWWNKGCGLGFTYYGFGLRLRLDHILYNNKLRLYNVDVKLSELSDHRPLIADFAINK